MCVNVYRSVKTKQEGPTLPKKTAPKSVGIIPAVPRHQYVNSSPQGASPVSSSSKKDSVESQYLHSPFTVASPTNSVISAGSTSLKFTRMTPPPTFYEATKESISQDPVSPDRRHLLREQSKGAEGMRRRLRSKSWDDLSDYTRMSVLRGDMEHAYSNDVFRMSDELSNNGTGVRFSSYSDITDQRNTRVSQHYMPMNVDVTLPRKDRKSRIRNPSIRKSRSIPNILEGGEGGAERWKAWNEHVRNMDMAMNNAKVNRNNTRFVPDSRNNGKPPKSPQKIMSPTGVKGINISEKTVSFKKQRSFESSSTSVNSSQLSLSTSPARVSQQNSNNPMQGRLLPTVPMTPNEGTLETLC